MKKLVVAALVAVLTTPGIVQAWVSLDGDDSPPHTAWPAIPVTWYAHEDGSADLGGFSSTLPVLQDAFDSWSEPSCTDWSTYYDGQTTRSPLDRDGRNVLGWVESGWPWSSSAIGVTSLYWSSSTRILEADIAFNGDDFTWNTTGTGGVDTQSIATHEMGHFLGLDHPACTAGETMCPTYGGGTGPRTLEPDDIAGVCGIYPSGYGTCTTDADCPSGFECDGSGVCVAAPGDLCDPCSDDYDCGSVDDYCLFGFPDGGSYCAQLCTTDADCPWGYVCVDLSTGSVRQCIPYDADCDPPPEPECAVDGDCPAGQTCNDQLCVSDVCAGCTDHAHCGGDDDYCLSGWPDGLMYCGSHCTTDADCDWGFDCQPITGGESQCIPRNNDCSDPPVPECNTDLECPPLHYCDDRMCRGYPCAPCEENEDCGGTQDYCIDAFADGNSYCGQRCSSPDHCDWGYNCVDLGAGVWQCMPHDSDCSEPPVRECETDDDCPPLNICDDGLCYRCLTDADCQEGELCEDNECVEDPLPHLPLCAECTEHSQCGGEDDYCVGGFVDGTSRCGVSCDSMGGDCGEGNTCFVLDGIPDQCLPSDMNCVPECVDDEDCEPGERCESEYCTDVCNPERPDDCPDGYYCDQSSCDTGRCRAEGDGTGADGAFCDTDDDCEGHRCEVMLGGSWCTSACTFPGGDCGPGAACQPLEGGECGYCSCSAGKMGDTCVSDVDCQPSLGCAVVDGAGTCTMTCDPADPQCPSGLTCTAVGDGSVSMCTSALLPMGAECALDADCQSGLCAASGARLHCSRSCTTRCTCPAGYACTDDGTGASTCLLPDDTPPDPAPQGSSGCGCAMTGAADRTPWILALAAAAIALLALRRR